MTDSNKEEPFNWAELRESLDHDKDGNKHKEYVTVKQKFLVKFWENPLVPIGCGLTATCLCVGMLSMSRGNPRLSQMAMRGRILGQAFTVAALIGGVIYGVSDKVTRSFSSQAK